MSIKANNQSVANTYEQTKRTMVNTANICKSVITKINNGNLEYALLSDDLIPNLRNLSSSLRDPSTLTANWVNALDAYATSQTTEEIDFLSLYVQIRSKILSTITHCVNQLPTENGYIAIYSIDESGVVTNRNSTDLSSVKTELLILVDLIE